MVKIVKKTDANIWAIRGKMNDFLENICKWDFIKEFKTNEWVIVKLYIFYHLKNDRFYMAYLDKNLKDYWNIWSMTSNTQFSWALKTINIYNDTSTIELYKTDKDFVKVLPV